MQGLYGWKVPHPDIRASSRFSWCRSPPSSLLYPPFRIPTLRPGSFSCSLPRTGSQDALKLPQRYLEVSARSVGPHTRRIHVAYNPHPSYTLDLRAGLSIMATEALLPIGAAYTGATQTDLDRAKAEAGESYFPTVFDPATVTRKGHAVIGRGRTSTTKGSTEGFKMYYEVHGSGPIRVAFVMGLNNTSFGWLPQVEHLAKDARYTCLVFDNRGVGNSETPQGWYKTSEMAEDTFELLSELEWLSSERSVHVVGVSMGGMIALEMARQKPSVLASLTLISTAPGKRFRTPTYGLTSLARVLAGRTLGFDSEQYRLNRLITTLFPESWLAEQSTKDATRTNQQVLYDMFKWRYAFTTRQNLHGAVSQMKAAITHFIPDAELAKINTNVPHIVILTGDTDFLVDPRNSFYLRDHLPTAKFHEFKNAGHALGNQIADQVNAILESTFAQASARN